MTSFEQYCVRGIEANRQKLNELMDQSLMLVTALVPHIGYDRAAEIAKRAYLDLCTLKQAAISLGYVTNEEYDRWVVPANMTFPSSQSNT